MVKKNSSEIGLWHFSVHLGLFQGSPSHLDITFWLFSDNQGLAELKDSKLPYFEVGHHERANFFHSSSWNLGDIIHFKTAATSNIHHRVSSGCEVMILDGERSRELRLI